MERSTEDMSVSVKEQQLPIIMEESKPEILVDESRKLIDDKMNLEQPKETLIETWIRKKLPGFPIIAKTTSFKEKWVNDIPRLDGEKKCKLDGACYSHSPPDMPLLKYNNYRKNQFAKGADQIPSLIRVKTNHRDSFFGRVHRRYPVDGTLESVLNMAPVRKKRLWESSDPDDLEMEPTVGSSIAESSPGTEQASQKVNSTSGSRTDRRRVSKKKNSCPNWCCCCSNWSGPSKKRKS